MRSLSIFALLVLATSCRADVTAEANAEAEHHERLDEGDLAVVRLTRAQVESLGIEIATVAKTDVSRKRDVAGTVTVPPDRAFVVAAPLAGTVRAAQTRLTAGARVRRDDVVLGLVPLAPVDRDMRAQARRQRDASRARLAVAQARLERTRSLVAQRGASQRALEEAEGELATAQAEDRAASARERMLRRSPLEADALLPIAAPQDGVIRSVTASPGQSVAAGAPLFDIASTTSLWVRVPIYPGDLDRLARDEAVLISRLGSDPASGEAAAPVAAPPSADPTAGSVDLFYVLPEGGAAFHPGERVVARIRYGEQQAQTTVPASAVVFDLDGGAWIYEVIDDASFRRRRVEVTDRDDGLAILRRGPVEGTRVVSVGALELLGAEFGVAH